MVLSLGQGVILLAIDLALRCRRFKKKKKMFRVSRLAISSELVKTKKIATLNYKTWFDVHCYITCHLVVGLLYLLEYTIATQRLNKGPTESPIGIRKETHTIFSSLFFLRSDRHESHDKNVCFDRCFCFSCECRL